MSEPVPGLPPMTCDEFLAWEKGVEERHEFIDGVVYAMSGGSSPHNRITLNVAASLWNAAGDGPCHVYQEGEKLRIGDDVFYPDVMVVCEPDGEDDRMAYAPCVVVGVLSPSSTRDDRERKLRKYRALPSLRAYLIVSQEYRHVERHWRESADAPRRREDRGADAGHVPVPCPVPGVLSFSQIYRSVAAPDRPPLRRVREEPAGEFAPGPA
ncbi:hypothetical protein tb265_08760 [Gemmatimonadetes bacterium T265]|nr:hypothetical protein tb265_08760 [Gemmatimonadetes bacterium T265]